MIRLMRWRCDFRWVVLFLLGLIWAIGLSSISIAAFASTPADRLTEQGRTFYSDRQFDQAVNRWQQAEQTYEQQGDRLAQAQTLAYLSLAYQQLGQWPQAQAAIDHCFDLLENTDSQDERSQILAQALNIRGRLEFSLGQSETALATWQQATAVYQQRSDRVGVTGSLINQAQALEAIGLSRRACVTLLEALEISSSCDRADFANLEFILNRLQAQPDLQVQALGFRNLGNVLRLVGYFEQSKQVLERSLSLQVNAATLLSLGETDRSLYEQAKNEADRFRSNENRNAVKARAEQALSYYQQAIDAAQTELQQIQVQLRQLSLLLDLQQWYRSIDAASDAETLQLQIQPLLNALYGGDALNQLPVSQAAIAARLQIAQLLQVQQPTTATEQLQLLRTAVQQAQELGDPRSISAALGSLGRFYEQTGEAANVQQAQQQTEQALNIAQAQQAWDLAYRWQWQLGRLYAAQGEPDRAIAYYQAAIETLEVVRSNLLALDAEVQLSFRSDVEPVYRELAALLLANPTQANLKLTVETIEGLQVSELENFLRCNLSRTVAIDRDQIDSETAIVYTILLPDRLSVILNPLHSDQLYLYTQAIATRELNATVRSLREALQNEDAILPERLALAQQAYDWLIRPFHAVLHDSSVQTLVFVLDGALRNIPMAALHDGQHYLIEDYAIALTPGLQLLQAQPLQARLDAIGFGLSEARLGFTPLAYVPAELEEIKAEIPAQIRLNQQFTSAAFRDVMLTSPASIVHLATHGSFSSVLRDTFILTWDQRLNIDNLSNILRSRDEGTTDPIELLVLSACQTATGDDRAALGLAGVAVRSGARSTIASLWSINDEATAELMQQFYQFLAEERSTLSRAEALRRSQLALLSDPDRQSPYYWAAFVLVGNWL
ncbi:CHAT domain-containing protein [Microcoleus sp. FACHB-1515]|uniref:CHAT domain-containing protein n=1 Tax=Cyanophyceae TaxID=3028117 RepID=UPI0016874906|nr:CHAT domain-containing protein [Microcoleus sp. FACHB-1515]MBD2088579.1 CHAT domain-containing protein [Microcoleus sp. FACHB-1515]